MLYFTVGAAVTVAVLIAIFRPGFAKTVLTTWQRYKEALLLGVGGLTTYYLLSTGVWYLVLLGAGGVVAAVWTIWFSDFSLTGWAR